jgi:putative heme transporter
VAVRVSVAVLRARWRPIVHWALAAVAVGALATQAPTLSHDLVLAGEPLAHLRWRWLFLAALAALGGLALYGEMHRQLLMVGGAKLSIPTVQAITFAQNAISNTVPVVGGAGALAYAIEQLRRQRVDAPLASWVVFVAGLLDTLALLVLAVLGLGWAAGVPIPLVTLGMAVIVVGAAGCWMLLIHPAVLRVAMHLLLVAGSHIPGLCLACRKTWARRAEQGARRLSVRVGLLRPSGRRWLTLSVLVIASWALDFLTLIATVAAVGSPVQMTVLVLGFLVVQASIALQIFPGGAGLASAGLFGVMVAAGVAVAPAAASTLVYRGITWMALALVGWVIYVIRIHTGPDIVHRHPPEHGQT